MRFAKENLRKALMVGKNYTEINQLHTILLEEVPEGDVNKTVFIIIKNYSHIIIQGRE